MKSTCFIPFLLLIVQQSVGQSQWLNTGSKIYYDAGNVGIGHSDPIDKLHVHGNTFIYGNIRLGQQLDGVGAGNQLIFNDHGNSDPIWMARYNVASNATELRMNIGDEGEAADKLSIGFTHWNGSGWSPKFTFQANGRLGIGNTSPSSLVNIGATEGEAGTAYESSTLLKVYQPFNSSITSASIDIGMCQPHARITGIGNTVDNGIGQLAFLL
ncbi:hypothetical protein [Paraflavitalea speifideaquila]|uniref:hypothetical protein n=1 Tax=Paraflavitalea speifideaquila TaxID=3076558 RepID=UPI0028E2FEDF|nr:hypothetical protein [Paraflavitalea speifideiaquila]